MKATLILPGTGLLLVLLFVGCSFDYEGARVDENLSESNPEAILLGFSQTVVENGHPVMKIEADRAELYESQNMTIAYGLHFTELGREGELLSEGWADKATYHNDTENAEFTGSVYINSQAEETSLRAQSISWDNENKVLTTPPESLVQLEKDDGAFLEGRGLEVDLRYREIQLGGKVKGTYVTSEDN